MIDKGARFVAVIANIDAANPRDPNHLEIEGRLDQAELLYGRRMTAILDRMAMHLSTFESPRAGTISSAGLRPARTTQRAAPAICAGATSLRSFTPGGWGKSWSWLATKLKISRAFARLFAKSD